MALLRRSLPLLLVLACAGAFGCRRPTVHTSAPAPTFKAPPAHPADPPLFAPRAQQPLALDGELAESIWRDAAHSGGFTDEKTGRLGVPHSELRVANDGRRLLLGLYAADENIVARAKKGDPQNVEDDAFIVQIKRVGDSSTWQFYVSANGTVRDDPPDQPGRLGAVCAVEMDGTMNDPHDDDEEWVAECLVPFSLFGGHIGDTLEFTAKRCDTPKGAERRCGIWQRRVAIE